MTLSDTMLVVIVIALLGIAVAIGHIIVSLLDGAIHSRGLEASEEGGIEAVTVSEDTTPEVSLWEKMKSMMTDYVPLEREEDILMDHSYDGIQELDNNLPPWWLYGFYLTCVIAVVYMGYYHVFDYGDSSREEYAAEMELAEEQLAYYLSRQTDQVDENTVQLMTSEDDLEAGKLLFNVNCIACHLESGGSMPGGVGPNLTDQYWLHGGSLSDIFSTIKYGVPAKGMISWQGQLRPRQMQQVASYILSLQGSNPPNAKEPQGELYVPEDAQAGPEDDNG